jgi:hypothetical protein
MRPLPFVAILFAILCLSAAPAANHDFRDTLLILDQQFWDASSKGDVQTLGRLIADDYVGIDQEDHRWNRPDLLAQLKTARTSDLHRATAREIIPLTDRSAILTYSARYKARQGDQITDSGLLRMSSTWVQRDGGWFIIFSQISAINRAASAPAPTASPAPNTQLRVPNLHQRSAAAAETKADFIATLHDPAQTTFAVGQSIQFDLKVHNPTKDVIDGQYFTEQAFYTPPTVENAHGQAVKVSPPNVELFGIWAMIPYHLDPGQAKLVASPTLSFNPDGPTDDPQHARMTCVAHAGPGKYKVTYPGANTVEVEIR